MARNYRLAAKPGLARAGRFVRTQAKPVIIINKSAQPQLQQIPKDQQPQKVVIRPPIKPQVRQVRENRVVQPKNVAISKRISSRTRESKNHHQSQYSRAIQRIKGVGTGRYLVMVACGPSILEIDFAKLVENPFIDFMVINKPDPRIYPARWWVFCDQSQYLRNRPEFENYPNTVINAWSVKARHKNQILIRNLAGKGFSKDLMKGYYIGRSTTFANMQTAYWMGYEKIFIFGCDMAPSDGGPLHFYGTNPDVDPKIRASRFAKEAEHYLHGAKQLTPQERMKFYFCSSYNKWPFVDHFKKMDHIGATDKILEMSNELRKTNE